MLENKGDGHITASAGSGININGSYSPINKLVIIGNYHVSNTEEFSNNNQLGSTAYNSILPNYQFEFGLGVYETALNENKYIDFIGGIGFGKSGTTTDLKSFTTDPLVYQTDFNSYFVQTTIASDITKDFIFAAGAKLTYLNFTEIEYPTAYFGVIEESFFANNQKVILQPFINLRYSFGIVGVNTNLGFGISQNDDFFTHKGIDFSVGLHLDFGKLKEYAKTNSVQ